MQTSVAAKAKIVLANEKHMKWSGEGVQCERFYCMGSLLRWGCMTCVVSPVESNFGGLVAQWITRLTTDQKIPGSNPGKLEPRF